MLDPSVRHPEPDLVVIGFVRPPRTLDLRGQKAAVVGIDAAGDPLQGHRRAAVESEDAIELLGKRDLVGVQLPGKAARLAQSLGVGELRLMAPDLQEEFAGTLEQSRLGTRGGPGMARRGAFPGDKDIDDRHD
jgi:hypothetical protein